MKNIITKTTLWFIVFLMSAVSALAQSDAELKTKLEKLNMEMSKAMVSGDMDKSLSYYTADVVSMPNYDKILSGIDAMKKSNEEMKKAGWSVTSFKANTISATSCGSSVTEYGTYEISFAMKGSDQPMKDAGKYVTIWEKQKDGSLKIKVEIWNTDKYPCEEK
jgi:ketosteroid isomerase-like protein